MKIFVVFIISLAGVYSQAGFNGIGNGENNDNCVQCGIGNGQGNSPAGGVAQR